METYHSACPECGRDDLKPIGHGEKCSFPRHKVGPRSYWCRGTGRLIDEPSGLHAVEVMMS